jgi:hypothetical protein
VRSLLSNDGMGRALTSIATGAATENSSGGSGFCASAFGANAATAIPAAVDFSKRRRLKDADMRFYECSLRLGPRVFGAAPLVSLNSSASFSVMAPPSSSASTMVTARR